MTVLQFLFPAAVSFWIQISAFPTIFFAISVCRNTLRPPPKELGLNGKPVNLEVTTITMLILLNQSYTMPLR